jgi:hypothetical protein
MISRNVIPSLARDGGDGYAVRLFFSTPMNGRLR